MSTNDSKTGEKVIFSCSGAADVGEIADRTARALKRDGFARAVCIAAVGAGVPGHIETAKGADVNIAINGCPRGCATKILESIGVTPVSYEVTAMGFAKGSSPATQEAVEAVYKTVKEGVASGSAS
ncbi:MAG TPA: putative zinc-binding protein [Spirochaetota bacterium]|nr:putative zinc-binding protein [Spirochaetota bacterium]HPJ35193.1 putative zinc-binding protein [Spirochaetota bacterium]